jgi:hypothetical protein
VEEGERGREGERERERERGRGIAYFSQVLSKSVAAVKNE